MSTDSITATSFELGEQEVSCDLQARGLRRLRQQFQIVWHEINKGYGENYFDGL